MEYTINDVGSDSTVTVSLEDGESVVTQRGAIAAKSSSVSASTGTGQGGLRGAVKSAATSGEAQLQNTLTADGEGWVELTAPLPCEIRSVELNGETVYTRASTYLGGEPALNVDYEAGSKLELVKNEGVSFTKVSGSGTMFVAAFGSSRDISMDGSEAYGIETGHVVLFDADLDYSLTRVGDVSATLIGGEGKICEFTGTGDIVMQTSSQDAFADYLSSEIGDDDSGGLGSLINQ